MKDLEVALAVHPAEPAVVTLAAIADALGTAGVNIEGGGLFVHAATAVAHYLVADSDALAAGTAVREVAGDPGAVVVRDVRLLRLDQTTPGTLARAARSLAPGPALVAQYSDHAGNLVLVLSADAQAARR